MSALSSDLINFMNASVNSAMFRIYIIVLMLSNLVLAPCR